MLVVTSLAALSASAVVTRADPAGLEGTWSGGGTVSFASGAREKARCNASFRRSSQTSYWVSGICATQSGKVSQTAEVFRTTSDRYRGNFHNPEFDISGTIAIAVHGGSMTATLASGSGTGVLTLRR
jgi:hypothetical protein